MNADQNFFFISDPRSSAFICGLSYYHYHLALASPIELTQKNPLPPP